MTSYYKAVGPVGGRATILRRLQLEWAARSEASRLHRLAVDAARALAAERARIEAQDARVFRCPGCGEWRYRSEYTCPGARRRCWACGARRAEA